MKIALAFLLTILLFTEENIDPSENDWVLRKDKNNIKVYTRQAEGAGMKEFKIIAIIEASVSQLVKTLEDVEAYPQWMSDVRSTRILEQLSQSEKYYYIEINAPWPISNRDNIIHFRLLDDSLTQAISIIVEGRPDYLPVKPDVVRIPHSGGRWEFRPTARGNTEVLSVYATNPGGSLPDWVINMFIVDRCYKSLVNLKKFVEGGLYAH